MEKETKKKSTLRLYIEKFKEVWSNPRGRATILLSFYGIFLLFVIGGVRTNLNNQNTTHTLPTEVESVDEKKDSKNDFTQLSNYEYDMKVTKNEEIKLFQGKRNGDSDLFIQTETNQAYYVENKQLYEVQDGMKRPIENALYNFDITAFTPEMLEKMIKQATLDYTTNYSTGIEKKSYILSLPAFMNMVYGSTISSNEIITITTSTKNKTIESVEIDLLGYEKEVDPNITKMTLEIVYKNIGGVEEFHID